MESSTYITIDHTLTKKHLRATIFKAYIYYVRKFYKEINLEDICIEAGLSLEYLTNEDNWVSVIFEKGFMEALQKRIKDKNFVRRVGEMGLQREISGKTFDYVACHVLTLSALYKNVPLMASLMNKVITVEAVEHRRGFAHYRFSPKVQGLNPNEERVLLSRIPVYMENIIGYCAALPVQKNLPMSDVSMERCQKHSYSMIIQYSHEVRTFIQHIVTFLLLYAFSFSIFFIPIGDYTSTLYVSFVSSLIGVSFNVFRDYKNANEKAKDFLNNAVELGYWSEKNNTVNSLLQKKTSEVSALTEVVNIISTSDTETEVFQFTCKALSHILHFDRSVVLLMNSSRSQLSYATGYGLDQKLESKLRSVKIDVAVDTPDPYQIWSAYSNRVPVLIENVEKNIPILEDKVCRELFKVSQSSSFAAVPIKTAGSNHGLLIFDCYHSMKPLHQDDLALIETICSQAAIAIERLRSREGLQVAHNETKMLSKSYSRFIPPEVLEQMGCKDISEIQLGDGVLKKRTVLFSDLRGFVSFCEKIDPREVLAFLNRYYQKLGPTIDKYGGLIDKFSGDNLMMTFSDPLTATLSGVEIQRALTHYNRERKRKGESLIHSGIGICQGKTIIGSVGFNRRMDVTVLSDSVNVASRLDSLCKSLDAKILTSGIPMANLSSVDPSLMIINQGKRFIKGREEPVEVLEVIDNKAYNMFRNYEWIGREPLDLGGVGREQGPSLEGVVKT